MQALRSVKVFDTSKPQNLGDRSCNPRSALLFAGIAKCKAPYNFELERTIPGFIAACRASPACLN